MQTDMTYREEKVGTVWCLVNRTKGTSDDKEVVVSFQGILCKIDMLPFNEKIM